MLLDDTFVSDAEPEDAAHESAELVEEKKG